MTRPASLRPMGSPFVQRKKKVGGKKLELDWEQIPESYNHQANDRWNLEDIGALRRELREAEEAGRLSRAKKIRREINQLLEQGLALRATFCGGCGLHLHRCKCRKMPEVHRSTEYRRKKRQEAKAEAVKEIVHRVLGEVRQELNREGIRRAG